MSTPKNQTMSLQGAVWLAVDGENFGGKNRIELLAHIAESGSITQAAKAIKMSYKAAWDAIDTMNNLAGEPLVERVTGGKGGGGTRLTQRGQQLVDNFKLIEQEHQQFIQQLAQHADKLADDFLLLKKMNMKTSVRNQYRGVITQIKRGAVNDEILLSIAGGQTMVANISHESTEELALQVGVEVFALIKSSSIILLSAGESQRLSARNQLQGHIVRIQEGAVNTEIVLELPGGATLAATITNESCHALALQVGQTATGIFKASSVILGVPA
ncbi:TOBE domain-containing protein [Undibacterium fentianense]|nr:TOBE domain-containing protein [Undibacterium fentianense]